MDNLIDRRTLVGATAAFVAVCALNPHQASAVTAAQKQAEVRAVKSQLEAIAEEASAAGDRYHQAMDAYEDATSRVEQARATIDEMSARIGTLQTRLDSRATSMYRQGSTSYLDVLLGVSSFADFATVWDTLNSLNEQDADLVASTKVAKSTLEAAQTELVEQQEQAKIQLASAEAYMQDVQSRQNEYDRMYNNLNSEYQQILAEQEAAEAQASARVPQNFVPTQPEAPAQPSGSSSSSSSSSSQSSSSGSKAPDLPTNGGVLDYAYSRLGCAYVWGASGPDAFDCSGFVAWCYGKVGISLPHYTESLYAQASARFSPSEAKPGDILYKPGHVGISTGGINCIEAMGSRWGVVESCRGGWTAALRF